MYIYQQSDWPQFIWQNDVVMPLLSDVRHAQGRLLGRVESLGFSLREEANLAMITQNIIHTSEIEGEKFALSEVRSSVAKRLGIETTDNSKELPHGADGIVDITIDATKNYHAPLTEQRLCDWHAALFSTGRSGMQRIVVGQWRTEASGAMQIVSGAIGHEKVHYEAPSAACLPHEMHVFIDWFNDCRHIDCLLAAAIVHFWFVTIHPFDDGNGRIARALADMMLARSDGIAQRFYSMSSQIQCERHAYYNILEHSQKSTTDMTKWIIWFLECLNRAILNAHNTLENIFLKAHFWQQHRHIVFNHRHIAILHKLLEGAFEDKLTTSKWAKITKCSQDTALRDIRAVAKVDSVTANRLQINNDFFKKVTFATALFYIC